MTNEIRPLVANVSHTYVDYSLVQVCLLPLLPSLQVGTFYPFFRGHAHLETARREPWLFGEPATSRIRTAIRERYVRLLPKT